MTETLTAPPLTPSRFDERSDWRALHDLVVETYRRAGRWLNWTPDRVDGYIRGRIHEELTGAGAGWRDDICLWRNGDGVLVAAVHAEGPEEAYLEILPGWEWLTPQVLGWAEERHAARHAGEELPELIAYARADDAVRQAILRDRGYRDAGPREVLFRRPLSARNHVRRLPHGYRARLFDANLPSDRRNLYDITRIVFHADFDDAALALEQQMLTPHDYLAVDGPDGRWAGWSGVWASRQVGAGQFEPVGTHPGHRRRGVASAVMNAGLDWMRERGLEFAFVGTGATNASTHLYRSLGFELVEVWHQWLSRPQG
jgi:ribosomal protein S18 acetylase RimI-like enzyme